MARLFGLWPRAASRPRARAAVLKSIARSLRNAARSSIPRDRTTRCCVSERASARTRRPRVVKKFPRIGGATDGANQRCSLRAQTDETTRRRTPYGPTRRHIRPLRTLPDPNPE